jgi:hypothetical protein
MTQKHEVLNKLFTDDNDVNANELYNLLSPFIKINKTNKSIIFLDSTLKYNLKNKIILFLLAKKVLYLVGDLESDRVKPVDMIKETGISKGSVLPTLKTLKEPKGGGLVSVDTAGYYVTSYQISKIKAKNILNNYEKNN